MTEPMTNATLLHELVDRRAARTPNAIAVRWSGQDWTYAELRKHSLAAAQRLYHYGVRRGERVLILTANHMSTLASVFAASRLGAIYVVVGHRSSSYYLCHILADCAPTVVLAEGEAAARVADLTTVPVLGLPTTPPTDPAGDDVPGGWTDTPIAVDPVSLIYTSGSTSLPKAVVSTHQQVLFAVDAIQTRLRYRNDDAVLCCMPLSFDYGLYQAFLTTQTGAVLVLGDERDAGPALVRRLVDERISVLPVVPSLAASLAKLLDRCDRPPDRLRLVTSTGASLPAAVCARLRARMPGVAVVAMFGLTECKRVSIAEPDADISRPGTVGRALPGTEVQVVDPDGRPLPPGEVGELVVRGSHVMAGYWNAPELTAARFSRDYLGRTTLRTGDYGRMDIDGNLYFVGRRDDIYKQNGFRISTAEVEAVALDIPGVDLAAALPPDDRHGARLAVSGAITPERLAKELRARMEGPRVPAEQRVFDAMPLNANGKLDRRAVAELWSHDV